VPVKTCAARRRVDLAEAATSALQAQLVARLPNPLGLVRSLADIAAGLPTAEGE
jgi:hypothetical protein